MARAASSRPPSGSSVMVSPFAGLVTSKVPPLRLSAQSPAISISISASVQGASAGARNLCCARVFSGGIDFPPVPADRQGIGTAEAGLSSRYNIVGRIAVGFDLRRQLLFPSKIVPGRLIVAEMTVVHPEKEIDLGPPPSGYRRESVLWRGLPRSIFLGRPTGSLSACPTSPVGRKRSTGPASRASNRGQSSARWRVHRAMPARADARPRRLPGGGFL